MSRNKFIGIAIVWFALLTSCKKEFLNAKPNDNLVVPTGIADMQYMLDNDGVMNGGRNIYGPDPSLAIASSDEFYLPPASYTALSDYNKAVYTWADAIPWPAADKNWKIPYRVVFYANAALDGLKDITPSTLELAAYNNVKGSALFFRAYQFYNLVQLFAPPYKAANAASDLGIPLRLTADISELSERATLKQTYDQIITDLEIAVSLLPRKSLMQTRPSKPAAFALLARVYLVMGDYSKTKAYCDSALNITNKLLDFNSIPPTQAIPFSVLNDEVLFQCSVTLANGALAAGASSNGLRIDSMLVNSYQANDLRLKLFFRTTTDGKYIFKGFYSGTTIPFTGIANDEVYLMKAEALARSGNKDEALESLNMLLRKRHSAATFTEVTAASPEVALNLILDERKKELVFRGLRWMDIRRLNIEGRNISIKRRANGTTYTLAPNDIKFTWPIPDDVIGLTGMPQNPR